MSVTVTANLRHTVVRRNAKVVHISHTGQPRALCGVHTYAQASVPETTENFCVTCLELLPPSIDPITMVVASGG